MDRWKFKEQYPELNSFILCFLEQSYENVDDEAIVNKYLNLPEDKKIIEQAHQVLMKSPFPSEAIQDISNRFFKNEEEARDWLVSVIQLLKTRTAKS